MGGRGPRAGIIADNTRRAYEVMLRQFDQSAYPETDAGVASYLVRLYEQGRSAACCRLGGGGAAFPGQAVRPAVAGGRDMAVRVLAGFRRKAAGRGRGKVAGVRWEAADRAAKMAEKAGDLIGLRDAAIVAVASDALLRVSEVAAWRWRTWIWWSRRW